MSNPFSGIPMTNTRSTWELLPIVVRSLLDEPGLTKGAQMKRLGISARRMQVILNGLLAIGVLEMIRVPAVNKDGQRNTIWRHRFGSKMRTLLLGFSPKELLAFAYEEFDRQYGPGGVPSKLTPGSRFAVGKRARQHFYGSGRASDGDAYRGVDVSTPGWPKMKPCPLCAVDRKAAHPGDRYHPECRKAAGQMASNADSISSGYRVSPTGGRRPL